MEAEADVIVVGGGIAGLIAASEAARAGASVELYEGHAELGGRARTRSIDGFHFNQGPHALYRAGAFGRALDRLQVAYTGSALDLQGALAVTGTRMSLIPFSPGAIARTDLLDDDGRRAMSRSIQALAGEIPPASGESVAHFLSRISANETVRTVLEVLVRLTTYCHAPENLDASAAVTQVRLGFKGVVYVDDGWGTLVEGLRQTAGALGVEIETASAVSAVDPASEEITVRFADGHTRRGKTVILAIGPREAERLAPGFASLGTATERVRPVRAMCLDLGLSSLPEPRHTYALGLVKPLYFSVHSAAARLAPSGAALIHVSRYLGDNEVVGQDGFEELESLVDLLQPGWRTLAIARQRLPAMLVANDYPQAALGGFGGRAPMQVPKNDRLYIAGDWVGPEGFLSDAAAASGTAAGLAAAVRALA